MDPTTDGCFHVSVDDFAQVYTLDFANFYSAYF
jgi:predicted RNase H-like HicB family nuclease